MTGNTLTILKKSEESYCCTLRIRIESEWSTFSISFFISNTMPAGSKLNNQMKSSNNLLHLTATSQRIFNLLTIYLHFLQNHNVKI